MPQILLYKRRFRVSDLARAIVCDKRFQLQAFRVKRTPQVQTEAMKLGSQIHEEYSNNPPWFELSTKAIKGFEYQKFKSHLESAFGRVFTRIVDDIEVRGYHDDYRILDVYERGKRIPEKKISLIEVRTIENPKWIPWTEIEVKKQQLRLYCWLLSPLIQYIGYSLARHHCVEIFDRKNRRLVRRIVIPSPDEEEIENWIRGRRNASMGLAHMKYPNRKRRTTSKIPIACSICYPHYKKNCWYWKKWRNTT